MTLREFLQLQGTFFRGLATEAPHGNNMRLPFSKNS